MENTKSKITKFEDIKKELEVLSIEYKDALKENDTAAIDKINVKYNELRSKLTNDDYYYTSMYNVDELRKQMEEETDSVKRQSLKDEYAAKNEQKKEYESNKSYVKFVKNAPTIEDYAKNKKDNRTFVQKTIKPALLVAALLVSGVVGYNLASKGNKTKVRIESTTEAMTEATTESTTEAMTEATTESTTEAKKKEDKQPKEVDLGVKIKYKTPTDKSTGVVINATGDVVSTGEVIEAQDPNVLNVESDTRVTVVEEIIKETPATEAQVQEYIFTETTEVQIPEQEVVTYEEIEEKIEPTTTAPVVVEEKTEETTTAPVVEETVEYVGEEKITYIEEEVTEEININNLPIEEDEAITLALRPRGGK